MLPNELKADQFSKYPPQARQLAVTHINLLASLPLGFLPLLLRELIAYDWKFPAERRELDNQFTYLISLSPGQHDLRAVDRARSTAACSTGNAARPFCAAPAGTIDEITTRREPTAADSRPRRLADRRRYGSLLHLDQPTVLAWRGALLVSRLV